MNFDRNTITGFLLLAVLFIGFFWYTNREQAMLQKEKAEQARKDSIEIHFTLVFDGLKAAKIGIGGQKEETGSKK